MKIIIVAIISTTITTKPQQTMKIIIEAIKTITKNSNTWEPCLLFPSLIIERSPFLLCLMVGRSSASKYSAPPRKDHTDTPPVPVPVGSPD